jgi:hypothetical protein
MIFDRWPTFLRSGLSLVGAMPGPGRTSRRRRGANPPRSHLLENRTLLNGSPPATPTAGREPPGPHGDLRDPVPGDRERPGRYRSPVQRTPSSWSLRPGPDGAGRSEGEYEAGTGVPASSPPLPRARAAGTASETPPGLRDPDIPGPSPPSNDRIGTRGDKSGGDLLPGESRRGRCPRPGSGLRHIRGRDGRPRLEPAPFHGEGGGDGIRDAAGAPDPTSPGPVPPSNDRIGHRGDKSGGDLLPGESRRGRCPRPGSGLRQGDEGSRDVQTLAP